MASSFITVVVVVAAAAFVGRRYGLLLGVIVESIRFMI